MRIATIGQTTPTPANVPPPPAAATEWAILIAAIAWLSRQAWALFEKKEAEESQITSGLINDLRKERTRLIDSATVGFEKVTAAIEHLKETLHEGQEDIDRDFQELKRDQAGEYAGLMVSIGKLQKTIDALHLRFDDLIGSRKCKSDEGD